MVLRRPAANATEFFPTEEHRYPSPMFFQQGMMDTSGAASPPVGGQLFAEDVRTHIPRAWAVDDDEDYASAEVRVTPALLGNTVYAYNRSKYYPFEI